MDRIDSWLDRIQNLIDIQKDMGYETVQTFFNNRDLIELRMMLTTLKELKESEE